MVSAGATVVVKVGDPTMVHAVTSVSPPVEEVALTFQPAKLAKSQSLKMEANE